MSAEKGHMNDRTVVFEIWRDVNKIWRDQEREKGREEGAQSSFPRNNVNFLLPIRTFCLFLKTFPYQLNSWSNFLLFLFFFCNSPHSLSRRRDSASAKNKKIKTQMYFPLF